MKESLLFNKASGGGGVAVGCSCCCGGSCVGGGGESSDFSRENSEQLIFMSANESPSSVCSKLASACPAKRYMGLLLGLLSAVAHALSYTFIKKASFLYGSEQSAITYAVQFVLLLAIIKCTPGRSTPLIHTNSNSTGKHQL